MVSQHVFGYSQSARAKCLGPPPCRGTTLSKGTLRYGQMTADQYGEKVEWRHWGCVTPDILQRLSTITLHQIAGFAELSSSDQAKIQLAVQLRRLDPADIPVSARQRHDPSVSTTQAQKKRKAAEESLQASSSQITYAQTPVAPDLVGWRDDEPQEVEVIEELYCTLHTNVVGIQYYLGLVGPGEEVLLVRDPQNKWDRNAIQVQNIREVQVGHVPANVALKLAPLLDRKAVTVEGVVNDGNLGRSTCYKLSISLKIFGPPDQRDVLEPQLVWATPRQRGFPPQNNQAGASSSEASTSGYNPALVNRSLVRPADPMHAQQIPGTRYMSGLSSKQQEAVAKQQDTLRKAVELKQMIEGLEKVSDEGRRSSLLDSICPVEDVLTLPLQPNPPGIQKGDLKVNLLKHQSQALKWCIEREHPVLPSQESDSPVQFWQYKTVNGKEPFYLNLATKTPQREPPVLGRGAICGDAMGLGKTLTMLSLILATKGDELSGTSKTTLIVSPLSIVSNWEEQIKSHCVPGALNTCVYYGSNKKLSTHDIQNYDVVITTYQTVVGEFDSLGVAGEERGRKKRKTEQVLFDVNWKRIILDEGHTIRNPKTKMTKSVCALKAERRWVLSGTPIINSLKDLGSLLTFLQICRPLDKEDFFKRLLLRPLKDGSLAGVELLSALMTQICLRRTKEMQDDQGKPLIPLPPVEVIRVPVTLHNEARQIYDQAKQLSRRHFEEYLRNRNAGGFFAQSNVVGMLTRMRQLALHPRLVPSNYLEELKKPYGANHAGSLTTLINPEEKLHLQYALAQAIEDCEECPICFDILNNPRITYCAHKFCLLCISEVISRDPKCPMDRRPISLNDLLEPPPPTELTQKPIRGSGSESSPGIRAGPSAKIDQLVRLLQLTPESEKSLVFSQFTSFLDIIEEAFIEAGIAYIRFDGQMSVKRRQAAIMRFSVPLKEPSQAHSSINLPRTTHSRRKGKAKKVDSDFEDNDDGDSNYVMEDAMNDDDFTGEVNPRVMLISLKAGALGLNLTVANNVYLMDPWWQEGIESQAIDRVNRIGQKKAVRVYQLIAEDTVESKVLEIQERKKKLVQQAFSGTKRRETQREQREARLQDLEELFNTRRQTVNDSNSD